MSHAGTTTRLTRTARVAGDVRARTQPCGLRQLAAGSVRCGSTHRSRWTVQLPRPRGATGLRTAARCDEASYSVRASCRDSRIPTWLASSGLKLTTVVTFLTDTEIRDRGEDRLPEGVRVVKSPISGEGLAEAAHEARTTGDFSKLPPTINLRIHRMLVDEAKEQYADLIRRAADPAQRPLVFHCSPRRAPHRDRSGNSSLRPRRAVEGRFARTTCSPTSIAGRRSKSASQHSRP